MFFVNIEPRITFNDAMSGGNRTDIIAALRTAYEGSPVFQRLVDRWLSDDTNGIGINYVPGEIAALGNFSGTIVIDPAAVENLQYIDNSGTARSDTLITALVHELVHALSQFQDNGVNENPNSWDYRGDTVVRSNLIYNELGLPEQNSYVAVDGTGGGILENGFEYTNGAEIDRSWVWSPEDRHGNGTFVQDWDTSNIWNSDDLLIGAELSNVLTSGGGDDFVYGGTGSDTLDGGRGDDFLHGGTGTDVRDVDDDELIGGRGNDIMVGGWGSDTLDGGSGRDLLIATDFADRYTDLFSNTLMGGNGDDVLVSTAGGDMLDGGQGNDLIIGGAGDDTINGGISADYIYTGGGADAIRGGAGNDWINATAPGSVATVYFDANSGRDYIQQAAVGSGYTGVESIVFEGLSGSDVELVFQVLTSDIYEELNTDRDGDPQLLREGEFTATAYIRVESTGASINIGEITVSLFEFYLGDTDESLLLERNVTVQMENEHRLVFEDGEIDPTNGSLIGNYYEWRRRYDPETGTYPPAPINDDSTVLAWDDAVEASINRYDNAPNNFANGFSNPFVRDDVNLLDPVTDYGLIGTTDAFGLLI